MRKRHRLILTVVGLFLLPSGAMGQQPVRWQPTLESAKRLAAQTDRLVLIHFWADWCHACRKMEREVFNRQEVASAVQTHYVPVKVNADYFPATRQQYGVTALPVDVIITPQGQMIERIQGLTAAAEYAAHLYRVADAAKGRGPETYAQGPSGPPPAMAGQAEPPRDPAGYQLPARPTQPDPRYADYYGRRGQAPVNNRYNDRVSTRPDTPQYVQAQRPTTSPQYAPPQRPAVSSQFPPQRPVAPPPPSQQQLVAGPSAPTAQIPPGNPALGLDGCCPVELAEKSKWTLGDRRWGAHHRGRTYLFSGPEQQRRFLAQPDRYAPVLSGNDVVMAIEQGKAVAGYREHGVFFGSKVYLFASEASLERFSADPNHYANQALQAMQPRGYQRQHFH